MRWQIVWLVLILLLALGAPGMRAQAAPPPAPDQPLSETLRAAGRARVLVHLDVSLHDGALLTEAEAEAQRQAAIQQAQDTVLSRLNGLTSDPIRRLRYVPMLALDVDLPMLEALRRDPLVQRVTDDPLLLPQLGESSALIGMPAIREQGFSGTGWTVAVLDTGIDRSHPFVGQNVRAEACFSTTFAPQRITSLCPNGQTSDEGPGAAVNCVPTTADDASGMDSCGHGTHVAGIVSGSGATFSGVAPGADIIAVQVFSKQQQDNGTSRIVAYSSDVLAALEHVYELRDTHRIAAINISLATPTHYTSAATCEQYSAYGAAHALVDQLRAAGIATIAATGNHADTNGISAPACLDNVISVGATTPNDTIWSDSNSAAFVDLLAPGEGIESAFPLEGFPGYKDFVRFSGTSQATAQVSGAWAVLKEAVPEASVSQIYEALRESGHPLRDLRNGIELPRLQLDAALATLQGTIGDCNGDARLDAGDLAALNGALSDPASSSASCDANRDSEISSADIPCTLRRIFGIPCDDTSAFASAVAAAPGNPPSGDTTRSGMPTLALPQHLTVRANQTITVPVTFRAGAEPVASVAFAIAYDHERLRFEATAPDAVSFATLPSGFRGYLAFDSTQAEGTIDMALLAATQADALPDGTTLAVLTFAVRNTDTDTTTPLTFAAEPGVSFGTPAGQSIAGSSSAGSIQISAAAQPALGTPAQVRAAADGSLSVPVVLAPNGVSVAKAAFCLRYNTTWLTPVAADDLLRLPAGVHGTLTASGPDYVCVTVGTETGAPHAAGEIARVRFGMRGTLPPEGMILLYLDAEQPIALTDPAGQPHEGAIDGGSLPGVRIFSALRTIYLPAVRA